jgi:nucleoside-diphosphate-sugar epimerase
MNETTGAVLVSGISGVVGQPLVNRLRELGYPVYEISRQPPTGGDPWKIHWDLESVDAPGLPTVEYYVHCAPVWVLPDNVPRLASAGVKRIVAFSSSSAISKQDSSDTGERELAERLRSSEDAAIQSCKKLGLSLTLFRPTMIYGFGRDQNVSRIAGILNRYRCGVIAGSGVGQRQPVHVLDLVDAVEKVLQNPRSFDKTYILVGGETVTYREMMRRIFLAMGLKPRIISIPTGIFRGLMRIAGLTGKFRYTPAMADRMNIDLSYDSNAAVRDFNYSPAPFLENPARDLPGMQQGQSN